MNWLEKIKQKYSLRVYGKRSRKVAFRHDFVDFDHATKIGFILNMNQFNSKDLIVLTDYITKLEDHGKSVVVIELNFQRRTEPMFNETIRSIFLNRENINWLEFPSLVKMKEINEAGIEIVLNLDTSERMTSRYICGLINAKTRVGMAREGEEEFYELMVELPEDVKLKPMIQQFETYLKMLEK
jgi:hypothetical protein